LEAVPQSRRRPIRMHRTLKNYGKKRVI